MAKSIRDIEREFSDLPTKFLKDLILRENQNFISHVKDLLLRAKLSKEYFEGLSEQIATKYNCENVNGFWVQKYYNPSTKTYDIPQRILSILNGKEENQDQKTGRSSNEMAITNA